MILLALLLMQQVQIHRAPPQQRPPGFPSVEYRAVFVDASYLPHNPLVDEDAVPLGISACQELIDNAPAGQIVWEKAHCVLVQTWMP